MAASYPNNVKSWTDKKDNEDWGFASHINDAYAELMAIESELISNVHKQPVRVATTANITLSGTQTVDGVTLAAGDRILVKDQTNPAQNGIYVVASGSWGRSVDADSAVKVKTGMRVYVIEGATNAGGVWELTTTGTITLGTTNLTFKNRLAEHLADNLYQVAGGTATAITLTIGETLVNGFPVNFTASASNAGAATTINGKKLFKPNTTTAPNLVAGKPYTAIYNSSGDSGNGCFFIKASAEGTAIAADVLAGKTFSNDDDTGIVGTNISKKWACGSYVTGATTETKTITLDFIPTKLILIGNPTGQPSHTLFTKIIDGVKTTYEPTNIVVNNYQVTLTMPSYFGSGTMDYTYLFVG
jgi:phage-related tail fiber protein